MKRVFIVFIVICFLFSSYLSVFAAPTQDVPGTKSFTWRRHSSLNSFFTSAMQSAASTWNSASTGFTFSYSSSIFNGNINVNDGYNCVAYASLDDPTLPADWGAVTYLSSYRHNNFDTVFNPGVTWGSGNSSSYYDRQGAATHELGHAIGMADYNWGMGPFPWPLASQVETMFGYMYYYGTPCSYYLRTLESPDISSATAIASQV